MRIDQIELWRCLLPYKQLWRTSYGDEPASDTVITRVQAGEFEGWGESCPLRLPTYSPETGATAYAMVSECFAPFLLGKTLNAPQDVTGLLAGFRGNPFAKAALETAVWDLFARAKGQPLHELLGGTRKNVSAGADFGIEDSIDELLGRIEAAIDRGHQRVKLKIDPQHDVEVVRAVRQAFPDLVFHVDCNGCYDINEHMGVLKELDKFNLAMFEQPFHHTDLLDHAEAQSKLNTPICLDESVTCPRDFEQALRIGACRVINVKPGRVGGLANSIRIEQLARDAGIPAWIGGMLESGLGVGLLIELASLEGFTYPGDIFPSDRFYVQDLTDRDVVMSDDCTFAVSTEPGTGYQPVRSRIEATAISHIELAVS